MHTSSIPIVVFTLLVCLASNIFAQNGIFQFEIRDRDELGLIPGKLVFLKDGEIVDLGLKSLGQIASRQNIVYTGNGKGTIEIPVGNYEVWCGRGLEYSADIKQIVIENGKKTREKFSIFREVDTRGFVGGDMHLHTLTYSGHGDADVDERLISCLGEGLEWVVATDHNHLTDYWPTLKRLGHTDLLQTSIGNEVTTPIGHFNTYPGSDGSQLVNAEQSDAQALFQSIRNAEEHQQIIQVNHPRFVNMDYFTMLGLDPRLGISDHDYWSWDFDAIEVLNETSGYGWDVSPDNPVSVKNDWFNFLHAGRKITAVGNSDSHTVSQILAGIPRNYIVSSTDQPELISEDELVQSIKRQQLTVNRGVFVNMTANGQPLGSLVTAVQGQVILHLNVQAPSWVVVDTVQLIENGRIIQTFPLNAANGVVRFDQNIYVNPYRDSWYILVAKGSKAMRPLVHDSPTPVTPLGFTNPIWVDQNGDGQFSHTVDFVTQILTTLSEDQLLDRLEQEEVFVPIAIGLLAKDDLVMPNKISLLSQLYERSDRDLRLLIYRSISKLDPAVFIALSEEEMNMLYPTLATLARFKAGYPIGMQELRDLRSSLLGLETPDVLSTWFTLGPLPVDGIQPEYSPELDKTIHSRSDSARWQRTRPQHDGWTILSNPSYCYAEIYSPERMERTFLLKSPNKIDIWVNGVMLNLNPQADSGIQLLNFRLLPGINRIMLKVDTASQNGGFMLEPIDLQGWLRPDQALKPVNMSLSFKKPVTYETNYSPKYNGGGKSALTDGLSGDASDFKSSWQGFQGADFKAVVDLNRSQTLRKIQVRFLQNHKSWIFLPETVSFEVSADGENFHQIQTLSSTPPSKGAPVYAEVFEVDTEAIQARYIRIAGQNIKTCPEWHEGSGNEAWIFADEIIVE